MRESFHTDYHEDYSGERRPGSIIAEHIVEEKDTLPDIARKYDVTIEEIVAANGETIKSPTDLITPGLKIMIPNKNRE